MSDEILNTLNKIIINIKPTAEITLGGELHNDLGFDSLDTISLYFDIEKAFDIKIPEADIEKYNLTNFDSLVEYIAEKL